MTPYKQQVYPVGSGPYGLHVPYNQGYDAQQNSKWQNADQLAPSGYFLWSGKQINLWISELTADFTISGETGQSRMMREFFPRSFNEVTLRLTGNTPNTQEFNRLAAFIREAHWTALRDIMQGGKTDPQITFGLYNQTPASWDSVHQKVTSGQRLPTVKGGHRPWTVTGFIKQVQAGAQRHEVAPEYTIEFVVATSSLTANTGIWSDTAAPATTLRSFLDLINIEKAQQRVHGGKFIPNPTAAPGAPSDPNRLANFPDSPPPSGWSVIASSLIGGLK